MNVTFGWNKLVHENNGLEQLVWQQLAGITGMEMAGDTECQNNSNYPITQKRFYVHQLSRRGTEISRKLSG
jgi:hypothetical protein